MESKIRESRHSAREVGNAYPLVGPSIEASASGASYRILHVDDDPNDRALMARELRSEIPNLTVIEIGNELSLNNALLEDHFDLVVTDYDLRWGNGLDLLRRLERDFPGVPVVMFTGTGNEEVAVEAMKGGVQDYVLKGPRHLPRLRASIKQCLARLQQSRELAVAEARYKDLFETVPVGLFRCSPKGEILDANAAFLTIIGYSSLNEFAGRNFAHIHPEPADFQLWRDQLERDGAVACVETRFKKVGVGICWVEIHAKAMRDPLTRQIYYEGSVEDITRRKNAESEREQLIDELRLALSRVKSLAGLLPICSSCKKIRDGSGQWNMLESFIENHSHAHFTHSFCPDCVQRLYPEVFLEIPQIPKQ